MDRRQMLVQRSREYLTDRLTDVLHMVRQDRQEMRGWQEPSHLRATLRRTVREVGTTTPTNETAEATQVRLMEQEFGRNAGEPDRGQQREALGQLLETGANALERLSRNATDFTPEELNGLEAVLLLYARPALLLSEGRLSTVPAFWNLLEDQREEIEMAQRGVGRIEMLGHPEYDWAGTGFLVGDNVLMTTRRCVELFAENRGTNTNSNWQFRPGISAWMDYRTFQSVSTAGYRVRRIIGVHDNYDMALLEVEGPQLNGNAPTPLSLAANPLPNMDGRPAYLLGYPVRDSRRNEPELVSRVFRDVYNVKRVQPGCLRNSFRFNEIELMRHDCAPLGQNPGGPILDLETHQVIGMQVSGRYMETNTAIPMWALRDDPLLQKAGVTFAALNNQEREQMMQQLERLSRSRYWNETKTTIENLYRRAFGYESR